MVEAREAGFEAPLLLEEAEEYLPVDGLDDDDDEQDEYGGDADLWLDPRYDEVAFLAHEHDIVVMDDGHTNSTDSDGHSGDACDTMSGSDTSDASSSTSD